MTNPEERLRAERAAELPSVVVVGKPAARRRERGEGKCLFHIHLD